MASQRIKFESPTGVSLAGIIDWPDEESFPKPRAFGIFSHCFTCTKDLKAIVRISRGLARNGIAILRFDFTGLGDSGGNFSDTNFDTNLADVRAAVRYLNENHEPPSLLMGHSLGGAAMMVMASEVKSAEALVTIASPSSLNHLARFLPETNPAIIEKGEGTVEIGGRTYVLKKQLVDNLLSHDLETAIEQITLPHLIFHPPDDATLAYWHAEKLFANTGGIKSMITLDGSDHLLVDQPFDVEFVAETVSLWLKRFMPEVR